MAAIKKCVNLKSFDMGIKLSCAENDLWRCIGAQLEHFSGNEALNSKGEQNEMFGWIRLYCPLLISYEAASHFHDSGLFNFILGYGQQMLRAPVGLLKEEELNKLAASCPNVRFSGEPLGSEARFTKRSKACLRFTDTVHFFAIDNLTTVSNLLAGCNHLENLALAPSAYREGTFSFHHQMMTLKKLELLGIVKCSELRGICMKAPNLEKLIVEFADIIPEGYFFDWISSTNTNLQTLSLLEPEELRRSSYLAYRPNRHNLFRDLVNSFAKSSLEWLNFTIVIGHKPYCELRTIVLPLCFKGIHCTLESNYFDGCFCEMNY